MTVRGLGEDNFGVSSEGVGSARGERSYLRTPPGRGHLHLEGYARDTWEALRFRRSFLAA